jgi:hypothetical protein
MKECNVLDEIWSHASDNNLATMTTRQALFLTININKDHNIFIHSREKVLLLQGAITPTFTLDNHTRLL